MAKVFRNTFTQTNAKAGLVVIGDTTISIPLEHLATIGHPRYVFLQLSEGDVYILPSDGSGVLDRVVSHRKGRKRCYIHLFPRERTQLKPDQYKPTATYLKLFEKMSLRLKRAESCKISKGY